MRFDKLDLNLLVALDALLTHRNISRAAEQLHLTQSALSAALGRLREYFGDELLVTVGRRMELTPRAQTLMDPVRDILVRVRATIVTRPDFDPAESDRTFNLLASDYSIGTFMPRLIRQASELGSRMSFRFLPLIEMPARALDRGDADLLVIPDAFRSQEHPFEVLFEEELVCVVWSESSHVREGLSSEQYNAASHVVMEPSAVQGRTFESMLVERAGISRKIAVSTYSFSSLPALVVGTEYVATLQRRLARRLAAHLPVQVVPAPMDLPKMPFIAQWHAYRTSDPAMHWLRSTLRAVVEADAASH